MLLGRYRLERMLGAGGFGVVWLAHDERLERDVAVKVIPREREGAEVARGAEREARAAARLNHPGVVALYELDHDEHSTYLVSELVRGRTFAELAHAGALSDSDVARIGIALCDALDHAHERGVIHRDVKPQNVMVLAEPDAGAGFAKLADFGVAHLASGDLLTRTGDVVGTLAYMAPEQAEGLRVTPAADVYSLALMLYEGWTGVNPVRGHGPAGTARRLGRRLPRLADSRRDLPYDLCDAIDACLEPNPTRRPPIASLRRALATAEPELSDEGGLVEPDTLMRFGLTSATDRTLIHRLVESRSSVPGRLAAGAAAGALMLAALEGLGPDPPISSPAAALTTAVMTALLPRIGWLVAAVCLVGWLASPTADRAGTALVLAAGLAPIPLLLPRAGLLWSAPAAAPILGVIALAPLFVALAGLCSTAWRRAGLAVAGFGWLVLAEIITGDALLFGPVDGTLPRAEWESSARDALTDALYPFLSSPAIVPVVIWAALAVVLPFVVRGRSLALDLLGAIVWAAALVSAHAATADLVASSVELDQARGAVGGALLAVVVAVAAAAVGLAARPVEDDPLP
ncbi:MAG TPA: serine/threonine-protein kinase [Thermoleophilaceae bacterium]|nr:serine/threonine-protein kinase [Thermoleophilaceae bacterium]